jgi:hypothetical protein
MWINHDGSEFTEDMVGEAVGFVYLITNLNTGKKYVGKKLFTKSKTYQKNKKKKRKRVSSDWQKYWGSNEELKADVKELGEQYFKRTILRLCSSKSQMSYYETYYIFFQHALLHPEDYYNSWVSCRINRNTLINITRRN